MSSTHLKSSTAASSQTNGIATLTNHLYPLTRAHPFSLLVCALPDSKHQAHSEIWYINPTPQCPGIALSKRQLSNFETGECWAEHRNRSKCLVTLFNHQWALSRSSNLNAIDGYVSDDGNGVPNQFHYGRDAREELPFRPKTNTTKDLSEGSIVRAGWNVRRQWGPFEPKTKFSTQSSPKACRFG